MGIWNKLLNANINAGKVIALERVLNWGEGGVHKRIDENRELLETLQLGCPQLLANKPWIIRWLKSQDAFLNALADISDVPNPQTSMNYGRPEDLHFPRPWPAAVPIKRVKPEPHYLVFRDDRPGTQPVSHAELEDFLQACSIQKESQQWEAILVGVPFEVDGATMRFEPVTAP